jgi:predicted MFS family arabinose efflux permease
MNKHSFAILCVGGAILSFNVAALSAIIPSIARTFGVEPFIAGRAIWLYMLPYGVFALFYGPLSRTFEIKYIKIATFSLFSLANLMAAVSRNIQQLFLARFFMGVFGAAVIPISLVIIAHSAAVSKRGRLLGFFFSVTFLSSLSGLFLSGIISWRLIFLIPAVAGIVLCLCMLFYLPHFKNQRGVFKLDYKAVLSSAYILRLFLYIFSISLLYHSLRQWLGVFFFERYAFSQFLISMLLTAISLSGFFGETCGGILSDRLGRIRIAESGIILMILSILCLLFRSPLWILFLVMIIWGLGWTFNHVSISGLITDLPKEFLPESASLNSSVRFLSGGLGAVIGGLLLERSFELGFIICAILLSILFMFTRNLKFTKQAPCPVR